MTPIMKFVTLLLQSLHFLEAARYFLLFFDSLTNFTFFCLYCGVTTKNERNLKDEYLHYCNSSDLPVCIQYDSYHWRSCVTLIYEEKKMQKSTNLEINKSIRRVWTICPVTRIKKSKKIYDRKKFKNFFED